MNDREMYDAEEEDDHRENEPPNCSICHKFLPVDNETGLLESVRISYVRLDFDGHIEEIDDVEGDYCKECWEKIKAFIRTMVK